MYAHSYILTYYHYSVVLTTLTSSLISLHPSWLSIAPGKFSTSYSESAQNIEAFAGCLSLIYLLLLIYWKMSIIRSSLILSQSHVYRIWIFSEIRDKEPYNWNYEQYFFLEKYTYINLHIRTCIYTHAPSHVYITYKVKNDYIYS